MRACVCVCVCVCVTERQTDRDTERERFTKLLSVERTLPRLCTEHSV